MLPPGRLAHNALTFREEPEVLTITILALEILCAAATLLCITATVATIRHARRPSPRVDSELPPVSMIKPLKGAEESLPGNLQSFFEQRYPGAFTIVFASADADDPAVAVARQVAARYPQIVVRFVRSNPSLGLNPKVANVAGALPAAQYDLVFQSDANVRLEPGHLAHIVHEFIHAQAHLLSSVVVGVGEKSVGAAIENVHLTGVIAPSVAFASWCARRACVVGKALLYRRSELDALGGMEQFKDVLAEDYLMGERYERAGKRVILSCATVQNVNERTTVTAFLARHTRWLKMNAVIDKLSFVLRFLVNPVWALALLLVGHSSRLAVAVALVTIVTSIASQQALFRALRTDWMNPRLVFLSLLDALLMWAVWPYTAISRSVNWRGKRLVLGKRTALHPPRERARAAAPSHRG